MGGFPRRSESPHDVFDGGHAGTGLSIAEGLAEARDLRHGMERIAVVVGDAALMSGLSLEALNDWSSATATDHGLDRAFGDACKAIDYVTSNH
jgi:deoxyxylulose-5-phosphate synthase